MLENAKRRKDKYNPYQLYLSNNEKYFVRIKNGKNSGEFMEIDKKIYLEMNRFELEDKSQLNKYDRYIEHSQITEQTLNKRAIKLEPTIESTVCSKIEKEEVCKAIFKLPEIQRKRIKMYFFEMHTQKEIADIENVSIRAVQYSIKIGLKNLKKILTKTS